jgi:dsDNA-specific endonuclease/ATPase MutS2
MPWLIAAVLLALVAIALGRRLPARAPGADPPLEPPPDVPVEFEDDTLDLHGIPPRELEALVSAFLDDACARRRSPVVIVHGRGIGVQRARVHALLAAHPKVLAFGPPADRGRHLGATAVDLDLRAFEVAPPEPPA